jgi:predicted acetyltransferase
MHCRANRWPIPMLDSKGAEGSNRASTVRVRRRFRMACGSTTPSPSAMKLVEPSPVWRNAFLDMARECEDAGEYRYALALQDFDAYLRRIENGRVAQAQREGWIPGTEFWLEDGGSIVACVRLRFWLDAALENEGGHIGYDVRPSMRLRGYGTALLGLALVEARARGIARVRVTCDADNLGSIKVIERNGGTYAGSGVSATTQKLVRQYWIESSS